MKIARVLAPVFVLLACLKSVPIIHAAAVEWTCKLPDSAKWQTVTTVGTLLVGTDKAISSLNPDNGEIMWARSEFPKSAPFNVREIPGTPILLISDQPGTINPQTQLHAINLLTGETLWETGKMAGAAVGAYPIHSKGLAVVFSNLHTEKEGPGLYLSAYDLASGKQLWRVKHSKLNEVPLHPADNSGTWFIKMDLSGHQEPVVEGEHLYVPFAGVHCFDLKSGALKWGVPFKTVPKEFKRASAPLLIDGDTVFAPGVNKVYALDKQTGAVKWESKKVYSGTVTQLLLAGDKLLVRLGGNFLEWGSKQWKLEKPLAVLALEKQSGSQIWEYKDLKDGITNLQLIDGAGTVFVADAQHLIGIDLNSAGTVKEAFKVKLEFKRKLGGGEAAAKIGLGALGGLAGITRAVVSSTSGKDRMDIPVAVLAQGQGQFVVRGRQHLLAFDGANKELKWSTYYAAPGVSGFEMAIMTSLTAFSGLYYNAAYASGTMSLNNASSSIARTLEGYNALFNKRYSATQASQRQTYILTTVQEGKSKGAGLVAIDMGTGESGAEVLLKDKEPEYAVDETTGRLFYIKGKKEVVSYLLK